MLKPSNHMLSAGAHNTPPERSAFATDSKNTLSPSCLAAGPGTKPYSLAVYKTQPQIYIYIYMGVAVCVSVCVKKEKGERETHHMKSIQNNCIISAMGNGVQKRNPCTFDQKII